MSPSPSAYARVGADGAELAGQPAATVGVAAHYCEPFGREASESEVGIAPEWTGRTARRSACAALCLLATLGLVAAARTAVLRGPTAARAGPAIARPEALWAENAPGDSPLRPDAAGAASTQLAALWAERAPGALFVGEYHEDCATASNLTAALAALQPRPSALFVEFFEFDVPRNRSALLSMYEEKTRGYQCGAQHAELVLEARRLGMRVHGLDNENITMSHLGPFWYLRYRSGGPYDEYMWFTIRHVMEQLTGGDQGRHSYVHFVGSRHFGNQRYLWDRCKGWTPSSDAPSLYDTPFLGVMLNTTLSACAGLDTCVQTGDNAWYELAHGAPTCGNVRHGTLGAWSRGCDSQLC